MREVHDLHDAEDQVQPGSEQDIDAAGIQSPEDDLQEYPKIVHDLISTCPAICNISACQ